MDHILDLSPENTTLERFRDALLALPPGDFLWQQFALSGSDKGAKPEILRKALTDDAALDRQASKIKRMYQAFCEGAESGDLLALSQELMGKSFRNRGPYTEFVFSPLLSPAHACLPFL